MDSYIELHSQHNEILTRNDPDAGYEYFWLNFKLSVNNTTFKYKYQDELCDISRELNLFKSHGEYDKIPELIQSFLKDFLWDMLKMQPIEMYHLRIAFTNVKRWIKLCELRLEFPVQGVTPYVPLSDQDMKYLYICYRIYLNNTDLKPKSFPVVPEIGKQYFLDLSIKYSRAGILNNLLEYYPNWTLSVIKKQYDISLPSGIKNGFKALKLLSDL